MPRLTAIVLGSAAGGGYPQWNCRCPVCQMAWDGADCVSPRTQASLAVSSDAASWTLLNASPDLRAQITATPALHPRGTARGSPIKAVLLSGGEIDQVAGLLNLREREPFALHATADTLAALDTNPMFDVLGGEFVTRRAASFGEKVALPCGATAELFAVTGKVPLYMEAGKQDLAAPPGGNVGVEIAANGARIAFVPGAAAIDDTLLERLGRADVVLFDGTLFTDDEMIRAGLGAKTGLRMGHMPIDGPTGSLAALAHLRARRIYIHINNSNPVLIDHSPERRKVEAAGWEVAHDGLRIEL
jgi:pyrroloquinoline quinone biosynthesis protein B